MVIAFRAKNSANTPSGNILFLPKPAGIATGDLMIVTVISDGSSSQNITISGYTKFGDASGQTSQRTDSFWKQITTDLTGNVNINSSITTSLLATVSVFYETTGIGDWTLEFDVGDRVASATSITTSSITTNNNSLLYIGFTNDDDETVISAPADMTNIDDHLMSSTACATYFELKNLDTLTKSLTWSGGTEELISNTGVWTSSVEPAVGTNMQINIGDTWKEVPSVQINIGDSWKEVVGIQQNIGDTWKEVF